MTRTPSILKSLESEQPKVNNLKMKKICAAIIDTWEPQLMKSYAIGQVLKLPQVSRVHVLCNQPPRISDERIHYVNIESISSGREYSNIILNRLHELVDESHCMVFQWDGFPLSPSKWTDEFLEYDYTGSPWYTDSTRQSGVVGNGGFSLISQNLLKTIKRLGISTMPDNFDDDTIICVDHRATLEREGIKFAPLKIAGKFSLEQYYMSYYMDNESLGFHGAFNLPQTIPEEILISMIDELNLRLRKNPLTLYWIMVNCIILKKDKFLKIYFSDPRNIDYITELIKIDEKGILKKYCPSKGVIRNPYLG